MNMIPMPTFMFGPQQSQPQSPPSQMVIVPARVARAMDFLQMLDAKTVERPVATELHIEIVKGAKLSDEEVATQATALHLLSQYFAGQLKPDDWEKPALAIQAHRISSKTPPGMVIHCPACAMSPRPECPLCHGAGRVIVVGAGAEETGQVE